MSKLPDFGFVFVLYFPIADKFYNPHRQGASGGSDIPKYYRTRIEAEKIIDSFKYRAEHWPKEYRKAEIPEIVKLALVPVENV